jgi:hypothetical protein
MAIKVRKAQYFYATVRGEPDEAFAVLTHFAKQGVNLLALNSVPMGPDSTQFTLFPEEPARFIETARAASLALDGPHHALLVQGDDEIGVVARLHSRLHKAGVDVYASNAVSDGRGYFGYVLYMRAADAERAAAALHE